MHVKTHQLMNMVNHMFSNTLNDMTTHQWMYV